MEQYKGDIYKVVSLLAYMLKPYDKEGLDIFFTLDPHKVNSRKSRKISSSVFHVPFVGISDMRGRLHSILQEHKDKFGTLISPPKTCFKRQPQQPQRPLSFYILTDAQWQPNDVGGLIKNLVGSMRDKGCPKEHAAIQFIRFGNDPASIAKLDELDHGLDLGATGMYVNSRAAFMIYWLTSCLRNPGISSITLTGMAMSGSNCWELSTTGTTTIRPNILAITFSRRPRKVGLLLNIVHSQCILLPLTSLILISRK